VAASRRFAYGDGTRLWFVRSSANPLFHTAARTFDGRFIAVVLSGSGSDATDGVQTVKANGGTVIVQDPASSEYAGMPEAAIRTGAVDYALPVVSIGPALVALVHGEPVANALG
jgi:two-component system chemotaxis response regulator CheB